MNKLKRCVWQALPKSGRTCVWLLKIILPVSLLVRLMQYYGLIDFLAGYMHPLFSLIGLPGALAIVFITSLFLPLYATIAVMTSLVMSVREATILTLMCLTAHNLLVECAVTKKTGSSFWGMLVLRIVSAFVIAIFLNGVLPVDNTPFELLTQTDTVTSLSSLLEAWARSSLVLTLTIVLIVTALMILQRVLDEYHLVEMISKPLTPLMKIFGLPRKAPFLWIVGNVVGLAYGGAVMIDMIEEGKISLEESNTVNYHLSISHSLLEDTLLFAALGISAWVIVLTRLFFAMAVVWGRKMIQSLVK